MKLCCMTIAKASGGEALTTWEFASSVPGLYYGTGSYISKKSNYWNFKLQNLWKIWEFVISEFLMVIFS